MNIVVVSKSNIRGYHFFKIKPDPDLKMVVRKEKGNAKDENAMTISMPPLNEIDSIYHKDKTRPRRNERECDQTVESIAGKIVGRVPANLCREFRKLLDSGDVVEILCCKEGDATTSKSPSTHSKFRYNPYGFDRRGGGAVIPCLFELHCYNRKRVEQKLESFFLNYTGTEELLS